MVGRADLKLLGALVHIGLNLPLPRQLLLQLLFSQFFSFLEIIRDLDRFLSFDFHHIGVGGDHFGLRVSGDSMIEAGINDGDTVIVKKANTADNGQIVVALIDDHEAMLKRLRRKGKVIALESANKRYETKIFGPDRVKVQGVLVSLYRNFQ